MDDKIFHCALNRIFLPEPEKGSRLIEAAGSARQVFDLDEYTLSTLTGPDTPRRLLIGSKALDEAAEELERLARKGIRFIPENDPTYPSLLKECPDGPIGLYVRGELPESGQDAVAIVGTRDISQYGTEWCGRIIEAIASCKERPLIVSGLAIGTDITAQQAALSAGLTTMGVMATGPDTIYPARHRRFGERLCQTPGCSLVTEFPPATAPMPYRFLQRNRIIAGLCRATIVIESRIRGGSLNTASYAFGYDRSVFALPGRVDDPRSQGCNWLIRNCIAESIETLEDLLKSLSLKRDSGKKKTEQKISETYAGCVGEDEVSRMSDLLLCIRSRRGQTVEELAGSTGLPIRTVTELTGLLEADGFICADLLGRYMINVKKM